MSTVVDPGQHKLITPNGTGRLGNPNGSGSTYASYGNDASADGTQSQGGGQGSTAGIQDGTGSR